VSSRERPSALAQARQSLGVQECAPPSPPKVGAGGQTLIASRRARRSSARRRGKVGAGGQTLIESRRARRSRARRRGKVGAGGQTLIESRRAKRSRARRRGKVGAGGQTLIESRRARRSSALEDSVAPGRQKACILPHERSERSDSSAPQRELPRTVTARRGATGRCSIIQRLMQAAMRP
jgi:hypothetical protein